MKLGMIGGIIMTLALTLSSPARALTPDFDYIARGWINPPNTVNMAPYWGAFGLQDQGTNYYTSGAPVAPSLYWERFNPESPLYQAWFGCYVVSDFPFASEWSKPNLTSDDIPNTIANVQQLVTIDQFVWLAAYGDPSPLALIDPNSVFVLPAGDGYFLLYATMATHSDVGSPTGIYPWHPPYSAHSDEVAAFAPVTYAAVARFKYFPSPDRLVVVYASSAAWATLDGTRHFTPPMVAAQQLEMVYSTTLGGKT
jgi:hypothetical protein